VSDEANHLPGGSFPSFATYSDADFKRTIWSALRLVAVAFVLGVPLLWWKRGWPSAALRPGRRHLRLRLV
jgi:hypothetical protein